MRQAVTDEEALKAKCPLCRKKPGEPCIYLRPPSAGRLRDDPKWGTPTKRPHGPRREARSRQLERQERALAMMPVAAPTVARWQIVQATRQYDEREYWQLYNWYKKNLHLFSEKNLFREI